MNWPSASLAKGRSGSVKVMAGLLAEGSPRRITDQEPPRFNGFSAAITRKRVQLGARLGPVGGELARRAIVAIGLADVAELLVGDRPAIMGDRRPRRMALERDGEQLQRLARILPPEQRRALVQIGFGLVRIERDRLVEIGRSLRRSRPRRSRRMPRFTWVATISYCDRSSCSSASSQRRMSRAGRH